MILPHIFAQFYYVHPAAAGGVLFNGVVFISSPAIFGSKFLFRVAQKHVAPLLYHAHHVTRILDGPLENREQGEFGSGAWQKEKPTPTTQACFETSMNYHVYVSCKNLPSMFLVF